MNSHAHAVCIHMQTCMNSRIAELLVTVQELRFTEQLDTVGFSGNLSLAVKAGDNEFRVFFHIFRYSQVLSSYVGIWM